MAQRTIAELKALFEAGDQPTQQNFWDIFDSFYHVTEYPQVPDYAYADLPSPNGTQLARVTDTLRGMWFDDGTRWARVGAAVYDITHFGAIGDGTTHPLSERYATLGAAQAVYPHANALTDEIDWAAFQLAANAAHTAGRGAVYIPDGEFVFNRFGKIYSNTEVFGNGVASRILALADIQNSTDNLKEPSGVTGMLYVPKQETNVEIHHLWLEGAWVSPAATGAACGILLGMGAQKCIIHDIWASGWWWSGIFAFGGSHVIQENHTFDNGVDGIEVQGSSSIVSNNYVSSNHNAGIEVASATFVTDNFNRSNGALGNTSGSESLAWNSNAGTWAIATNAAAASALNGSGLALATVTTPELYQVVSAAVTRGGGNAGVVARVTDANNYVRAYHDGTNVVVDQVLDGAVTNLISAATAYSAGAILSLVCCETTVSVWYNGAQVGTPQPLTGAALLTGYGVGLYTTNTGNSFDTFTACMPMRGHIVANNILVKNAIGILGTFTFSMGLLVLGNDIDSSSGRGMDLGCQGSTNQFQKGLRIIANRVRNNTTSASGIALTNIIHPFVIAFNEIFDLLVGSGPSGINLLGTLTNGAVVNNTVSNAWVGIAVSTSMTNSLISGNVLVSMRGAAVSPTGGSGVLFKNNIGYVTDNEGATATVADGGNISHGLAGAATVVVANGTVAGETVSIASLAPGGDTSKFQVAIKKPDGSAGTTQTIHWRARK